jgi:uncharacterized protein with HEPN domain
MTCSAPDDYLADDMLRAPVERQFAIVGEALGGLRRADAALAAAIPNLARVVAFRNVIIHGYASIDDQPVRRVAQPTGALRSCRLSPHWSVSVAPRRRARLAV